MTAAAAQVFSGVTPEQYAQLVEKAAAAGIALTGNAGKAETFGVEVEWNYSPDSQELTIQCLSTPFFITPDAVNARIAGLVKGVTG